MDNFFKILTTLTISLSIAACGGGDDDDNEGGLSVLVTDLGSHQVLAFNDLGMHCADLDYSTFVILPPFNVVHAQVIERAAEPRILDATEVGVSYAGITDAAGSINTTSRNKTNFWDHVNALFNQDPPPDEGLSFGQAMPGILSPSVPNDPQAFNHFDPVKGWFAADGIPILPIDDAQQLNAYPLMQVSAKDVTSGETLATLDAVLPVAAEADCQNCHALGEVAAPIDSQIDFVWPVNDNDPNSVLEAAKINILLLHDAKHVTDLFNQRPVLCAGCHYSAALDLEGTGPNNVQLTHAKMSQVMHGHHGDLTDPVTGDLLFPTDGSLDETCYQCHPGKVTQCLRGAMGGAGIECKDCHGSMLAVGRDTREPWLDEPRCESCHTGDALDNLTSDIRFLVAWDDDINIATPRLADNKRFAENTDTLYRNSLGHGGVACEGCHGSTHAIWPNALASANDNLAAIQLQGHAGAISECVACHTSLPLGLGGPHGMHNVNSTSWTLGHENFYDSNPNACRACHGLNLEGTVLSLTATDRDYLRDDDGSTIHLAKGTQVSCDLCHGKP